MTALQLKGVRKRYGKTVALDGLDLRVPKGSIFGLIGPNGAGKTTTFGIASGAIGLDAGEVDVLGQGSFDASLHAGRVSVLPQDCQLNPFSSARQLLTFFARLQGLSRSEARKDADRVLDLVHLRDRADARVKQLSHGMRRRLAVAQALLGDPELVLLDEPTGGLDPHLVVEMRELLKAQARRRTIVISTHILTDIESTCDEVAFMEAGRCVRSGKLGAIVGAAKRVRVRLAKTLALAEFGDLPADAKLDGLELTYSLNAADEEDLATQQQALIRHLLDGGAQILELQLGDSLEDAYLSLREELAPKRDKSE